MESYVDGLLTDVPESAQLSALLNDLDQPPQPKDLFAVQQRRSWDKSVEARCDFSYRLRMTRRSDVNFISIWHKTVHGRTSTDSSADPAVVEFCATNIGPAMCETIGHNLDKGGWCICTSPKRRHKARNFATLISERIAESLAIPFYEDVATCRTRQRVNAVFDLNVLPKEPNIIVFDDFVTTGQTLAAMKQLLAPYRKNLVFFTCIDNKL